MKMKLKKVFQLPSVVDLGWSKSEALPIRRVQPDVQGYTWEDYYDKMEKEHPVLFFLNVTLRRFISVNFVMPLQELKYYIRDQLIRRTHLLDLRQNSSVIGCDDYNGGFIDPRTQILYACMNSLDRFIDESKAFDHLKWLRNELALLPADAVDRQVLEDNIMLHSEAISIHNWWHNDRKSEYIRLNQKQDQAYTLEMKQEVYAE